MAEIDLADLEYEIEESEEEAAPTKNSRADPDEFFAKNAFRVVYQTNNFLLPQLRDLIKTGEILNLRPEYQRRLRWSTPQKSRLIESLLLNIPVPSLFLYEREEARYEVMDGQQRLNAVKEFMEGDFALSSLQVLTPLNGYRYSRFPPRVKRALDRASLAAIILLTESSSELETKNKTSVTEIRRFIFDRLNTGGAKLNAQEIRNAIYPGAFNRIIVDIAREDMFTSIFRIPPYKETHPNEYYENPQRQKNALYASMGDCQLVLRYFALRDVSNIRGSMKAMLDRAMESRMSMSESDALAAKGEFLARLSAAAELFGQGVFMLPPDEKGVSRLSAALFDSTMVAIDRTWSDLGAMLGAAEAIRAELARAFQNEELTKLLTGQANTAQAVKERIDLVESIISVR